MRRITIILALLSLSACATSGSHYSEVKTSYPAVAPTSSRIFLYRESHMFASGVQPDVMLDGAKVRESVSGTYTVIETTPGTHTVSAKTPTADERNLAFTAPAGGTTYIAEEGGIGGLMGVVTFSQATPAAAEQSLSDLHVRPPVTTQPAKE